MMGPWGLASMKARMVDSDSHEVLVQKVLCLSAKMRTARLPGELRAWRAARITLA